MAGKSKIELNTETAVELLVSMRQNDQANFDRVAASIDALTLSIAQLTAQQKATAQNIENLTQAINSHLALAQQQSANIEALTKLATALASR